MFIDKSLTNGKGNLLKKESGIVVIPPKSDSEKDESIHLTITEKDFDEEILEEKQIPIPPAKIKPAEKISKTAARDSELELEIKSVLGEPAEESAIGISVSKLQILPDYEPTLDLQNYRYPSLDLLDVHGSDRIIQDANELEANKSQIINTLKNYDIEIQKISATVGPTVTLYEIVPEA